MASSVIAGEDERQALAPSMAIGEQETRVCPIAEPVFQFDHALNAESFRDERGIGVEQYTRCGRHSVDGDKLWRARRGCSDAHSLPACQLARSVGARLFRPDYACCLMENSDNVARQIPTNKTRDIECSRLEDQVAFRIPPNDRNVVDLRTQRLATDDINAVAIRRDNLLILHGDRPAARTLPLGRDQSLLAMRIQS